MKEDLVKQIDDLLPQTQCGLCEYKDCLHYAKALANDEVTIDKCLPGGKEVLHRLAELLQHDAAPYLKEMVIKAKSPSVVVIREEECIGCVKCIQACPVDAIIGASKHMHTVLSDVCTGCDLCIEPCPMDCIDVIAKDPLNSQAEQTMRQQSRERYDARQLRLQRLEQERKLRHEQAKLSQNPQLTVAARKAAIEASLQRVASKQN